MPNNLKDPIEKNLYSNRRILGRSKRKYANQMVRETNLKRKLKKGLVYGTVLSALALGIYGGNHYWNEYQSYVADQKKKIPYYQKKFDSVKYYYNKKDYLWADKLSEDLQEEMSDESFLSPTNDLYDKVKEYDDKFIDPEVKRIKREQFKRKLEGIPYNIKNRWNETYDKVRDKWDYATPKEKAGVVFGSMILLALLCRIFFRKK